MDEILDLKINPGKAPLDLAPSGPAKNLLQQFSQTLAHEEAVEPDTDMEDACDYHNSGSYLSSRAVPGLHFFVTFLCNSTSCFSQLTYQSVRFDSVLFRQSRSHLTPIIAKGLVLRKRMKTRQNGKVYLIILSVWKS